MVINMSMNKIKYILLFILSFLLININVYADESCASFSSAGNPLREGGTKEICESHSFEGKKCKWDDSKPLYEKCYKSDEDVEGGQDGKEKGYKYCSDIGDEQTCNSTDIDGRKCQWGISTENGTKGHMVCKADNHYSSGEEIPEEDEKKLDALEKEDKANSLPSAKEWKAAECTELDSDKCKKRQDCKLVGGTCKKSQVADDPCNEQSIRKTFRFFGYLLMIAKFIVPLIIIGFATIDLYKALVDKDEKSLNKKLRMVGIRILTGLIVFFMPTIVSAFLGLSEKTSVKNDEQYKICAECILKPTKKNLCKLDSD